MTQSLIENSKIYFPKDDVQSLRDIMGFQFDMNRHCSGNRPKTCSLSVTQWWMRNHVIISMTVNMDSVYPQNKAYDHSYIHILHSRLSFFFIWLNHLPDALVHIWADFLLFWRWKEWNEREQALSKAKSRVHTQVELIYHNLQFMYFVTNFT